MYDLNHPSAIWRKSSRSAGNGQCVEVAHLRQSRIGIRDSKDRRVEAPVLTLTSGQFSAFIREVKKGRFDI
jgi:hypothetical protein